MICTGDCKHRKDEYCELFDDVLGFVDCVFGDDDDE